MKLRGLLTRLRQNTIARNTGSMFFGQGVRAVLQGAYFVLIARAIGPDGYGAFVGAASYIAIAAPFSSIGSGNILIKNVARDPSTFGIYWGNALAITLVSGLALSFLLLLASRLILPAAISPWLLLSVAFADLIFSRLVDVSAQAFQAFDKIGRSAQLYTLSSFAKLMAVAVLFVQPSTASAVTWGWLYLFGTAASAIVALSLVRRDLGRAAPAVERIRGELREGVHFSVSWSAQNLYNDIDKTMLARYATLESTGTYGAAYRLIDIAFVPVSSLLWASYAGFFRHGAGGLDASQKYGRRFVPIVVLYGLAAAAGLYVIAPLIPLVVGIKYRDTLFAVRWLALLPLLKSLHYFAGSVLAGAGFQGLRSRIQAGLAIFNVAINFWLIPAYSWRGAAWSSIATDGLLAALLWAAVIRLSRKASRECISAT